jgi:hypothetical protein
MKRHKPETLLREGIRKYLRIMGYYVITNYQSALSYPGISDLTVLKDGKTWWVEIKLPKGKLSEGQVKFQSEIEAVRGVYLVWRSLNDAVDFVNGISN